MSFPKVHLRDIPDSGADYSFVVDGPWLSTALEGTDFKPASDPAGTMSVGMNLSGDDVVLRGKGSVLLATECVRCLEALNVKVDCDFSLLLEPASSVKRPASGGSDDESEYELSDDELDRDVYHDDTVEVGSWVREQILIELPAHPAHESCSPPAVIQPETKVKDPRLAGLEKFKIKE